MHKSPSRRTDGMGVLNSLAEKSGCGSFRQKQPDVRQQFLKSLPDPQGQRSLRPSFSSSSLSPCTTRTPRFTCVSDGNPRRRLLIDSKGRVFVEVVNAHGTPPFLTWLKWSLLVVIDARHIKSPTGSASIVDHQATGCLGSTNGSPQIEKPATRQMSARPEAVESRIVQPVHSSSTTDRSGASST
jgi:hypothetical protein